MINGVDFLCFAKNVNISRCFCLVLVFEVLLACGFDKVFKIVIHGVDLIFVETIVRNVSNNRA